MPVRPLAHSRLSVTVLLVAVTLAIASSAHAGPVSPIIIDSLSTWLSDVGGSAVTASTSNLGSNNSTTSSVSLNGGGSFTSSTPLQILQIGSGWATWPGGYTGQVLSSQGGSSITIRPAGIGALGFQVEPNAFANYNVTVTLATGQTLTDQVNGRAGAQFFGYYGLNVTSVTVSSDPASNGFAIGNFIAPSFSAITHGTVNKIVSNNANINGTFTPNSGLTLSQAATDLGFAAFDWQQTITTIPDPVPFQLANGTPLSSRSAPFNDAPPGGYNYPESQQPPFLGAYPFYYAPVYLTGGCAEEDSSHNCLVPIINAAGTTLNFFDSPNDPCLPSGNGGGCNGATAPAGSFIGFTTELVGVFPVTNHVDPLGIGWTWTDTFSGHSGGISLTSLIPADPNSGIGGITVTGTFDSTIPEPSTMIMLAGGLFVILFIRRLQSR